jgi:hypothetical protein
MTTNPIMILICVLVGFGGALIGWNVGLGLFAVLFEVLRHQDLDAALDSKRILENVRDAGAVIGFIAGVFLVWRWLPRSAAAVQPCVRKIVVLSALAGAGGAVIAHKADVGGLLIGFFGISKDAYILAMLLSSFFMLLVGGAIVTGHLTERRPARRLILRLVLGWAGAFALLFASLAFDKRISNSVEKLGEAKYLTFMIGFPAGMTAPPDKETIRAEIRTDKGTTKHYVLDWLQDDKDRYALRGAVDLKERTRDRTLVVTMPGQPTLIFNLNLPANPGINHTYGTPKRVDFIEPPGQPRRPATKDDDYEMAFLVR